MGPLDCGVLGQDRTEAKSNEITPIPRRLELPEPKGKAKLTFENSQQQLLPFAYNNGANPRRCQAFCLWVLAQSLMTTRGTRTEPMLLPSTVCAVHVKSSRVALVAAF